MSKRFCISLKDSEYEAIEEEAKKLGLKPIDLLNKAIKESVEIQSLNTTIELQNKKLELNKLELKNEIKELKEQVFNLQKLLIESTRSNCEYMSYLKSSIKSLLTNLMKSKTHEESNKLMEEILNESIIDSKKNFDQIIGKY